MTLLMAATSCIFWCATALAIAASLEALAFVCLALSRFPSSHSSDAST